MRYVANVLLATVGLSFAPLAAFAAMLTTGRIAASSAAMGAAASLAGALLVAVIWARDLGVLSAAIRDAGAERRPVILNAVPRLPAVARLARQIERLSRATAARSALAEQIRRADETIVERLPDPLIVLDGGRAVRRANASARATYGADLRAVLRHPGLRAAIEAAFAQTPQSDGARVAEASVTLPVPVPRDVRATVLVLDPPLADGGQVLVQLSDRTHERAVERTRSDFVANASHELRTPLASLIGFIDTLRGPARDDVPAQQRFLLIMAEQAARMNRLIDDLLSLSRVELTEHRPPEGLVRLETLITRVAAAFEPRIQARSVTLTIQTDPALPEVPGDPDQIIQVLQNLMDNAVKYGREAGTVRVTAAVAAPGGRFPARPGVVIAVTDDGAGIAREHLPRLTERFYRVDKGRARAVGGTGLGLAICKHIVNRHRGALLIDSGEGAGTTVSVWLPLRVAPAPAEPAARAYAAGS